MNIVTFTGVDGEPGVIWPAPNAQLPGEDDVVFLERITALSLPDDATNVQTIAASSYVEPQAVPAQPSPREWLERLSLETQQAITQAAIASPSILLWLLKASGSTSIDVTLQETRDGVAALVTTGVLTQEDSLALLA